MSVTRSQTTRGLSSANSSDGYAPASMPRTPSRTSRVSVSYGAARVVTASRSSTDQRSMTVIATSCWARTSSGLRGMVVVSIAPSCIRRVTIAHSSRSPRYFGKMTPFDGAPTWCPARPIRCSPRATLVGLSTWMTRSTAPMSIPSSRLEVATSAGRRPALSSSSIATRCSRAMLPWWARTSSSPASSLSRWASRSDSRRLLVNTIVLWWLRISSRIAGWIAGQMLVRRSGLVAGPPGCSSGGSSSPIAAMSSTGTTTCRSSALRVPASTIATSRSVPIPPRKRAIVSSGRCVADRPIRCIGGVSPDGSRRASRRSRLSARWAPRFEPAMAWTSSTMTCSTPRSTSRAALVSIRYSDSGVVIRMSGAWRAIWRRSSAGVSPVRLATEITGGGSPSRAAASPIPVSGARRLRSMS